MRIAVLGTGRMGRLRTAALGRDPDVEEVMLAGGDPGRTRAAAEACGAHAATVDEALAGRPDGVVVASATARHREHLEASARLGVPVLCEKPIALTVEDTQATVDLLRDAGVPVQIGFQRRFDPAIRAARDAAAGGRLGALYSLRITVRDAEPAPEHFIGSSGGMFRDMHVHDFDLARWVTGREAATVYATGAVRGFERFARHGDVDTSAIVLTMDDGMPVVIDGSRHDPRGYDMRLEVLGSQDVAAVGPDDRRWASFEERFSEAFAAETEAFVRLVRDGGESACPPETALQALRIAEACDRSRAEGRPVAV